MLLRILIVVSIIFFSISIVFRNRKDLSINRVIIDTIQINEPLILSYSLNSLEQGAVLDPNTVNTNNWVIYGHRFSNRNPFKRYFRNLDRTKIGDKVIVLFRNHRYSFKIINIYTVNNGDLWALSETKLFTLTLVTCTPILNPVNRLIVVAQLVSIY